MATIEKLFYRWRTAFFRLLLSDKVRPFVWLYYIPLWLWGIYGTFFAAPASHVEPVMGHAAYDIWIWTDLCATMLCMAGLWLEGRNSGLEHNRPVGHRDQLSYIGTGWQVGGHLCMFTVLFAFWLSALQAIPWGDPFAFVIFVISPYVIGCFLLAVQAYVKLLYAERIKQYIESGGVF